MISRSREIRLAHGGGGKLTRQLVEEVFLPVFENKALRRLDDSAVLNIPEDRIAFTTDSFVVYPLFFPGGDIGRLAVCGTVNDLAVMGASPLYLSAGFIIEEGFNLDDLKKIIHSMKEAADEAGITVVTGDTKVVERGNADGLFINTSGVGLLPEGIKLSGSGVKAGDLILVNGFLGKHGLSVITARENFGFKSTIHSDVAPLNRLIQDALAVTNEIHAFRDATRGGVATVLNEWASQSSVGIELDEEEIPVCDDVRGACELLGFDPLYLANEGIVVVAVTRDKAEQVLNRWKKLKYGKESAIIGEVVHKPEGCVILRTLLGSHRILDMLSGEQLPRIC